MVYTVGNSSKLNECSAIVLRAAMDHVSVKRGKIKVEILSVTSTAVVSMNGLSLALFDPDTSAHRVRRTDQTVREPGLRGNPGWADQATKCMAIGRKMIKSEAALTKTVEHVVRVGMSMLYKHAQNDKTHKVFHHRGLPYHNTPHVLRVKQRR